MSTERHIALFGGTFDPVHLGHLDIATKAREACDIDEVHFLPCRQSPHKKSAPGASDSQRVEMLKIAIAGLPWARLNELELQSPPPSYMWQTLRQLRAQANAATRFHLLIGLDQWQALPRWSRPDYLAAHLHFIVVGRDGHPEPRHGYEASFLAGNHPASSSEIRRQLAAGEEPDWLPPAVRAYISAQQLYQIES
ncbi:MAG: nicotinate (nicotinamide) nucleotide adenylyltransferase [Verrucomicrobiales bacterium]